MNFNNSWAIGVDLGGTKIETALVSSSGKVGDRIRQKTFVEKGAEIVEQQIIAMVSELRTKEASLTTTGIGVGVAGQIEAETGCVRRAPNLDWRDVPLQSHLRDRLGLPVMVMNDVRAATWGEWLYGAGKDCDDLICLFIGTGIGGGVVSGGQILSGSTNSAGELGHITVDRRGPPCSCRNRGCVEAIAGGWAIARRAQEAIGNDPSGGKMMLNLAGGRIADITARTVFESFRENDPMAREIVDDAIHALGAAAVSLVNSFNPKRLILGGGVTEGLPELAERVKNHVNEHALRTAVEQLEVLPAKLGSEAGVVGAAALVHRSVKEAATR